MKGPARNGTNNHPDRPLVLLYTQGIHFFLPIFCFFAGLPAVLPFQKIRIRPTARAAYGQGGFCLP